MSSNRRYLSYFIADVHLGLEIEGGDERELLFANFLYNLPEECEALYFLGDLFDFWYEYKHVIPRKFTRTLGALAHLHDRGVKLYFLRGNHDLWCYNYLQEEIGVVVLEELVQVEIGERRFSLAHGDELTGERGHLFLKRIFKNRFLQRLFSALHPYIAFSIATKWSKHNRLVKREQHSFEGEKSPLYSVAAKIEQESDVDYFIFGHMHTPGDTLTPKGAGFYILGEWVNDCQYLIYNSKEDQLTWHNGPLCNLLKKY